jgi:hypothetical protein
MKTMTTAEFAKANLAGIEEPIEVRRYTKVMGVYYPGSFSPAEIPVLPAFDPLLMDTLTEPVDAAKPVVIATRKRVEELEDEVKRLKRELAARPTTPAQPVGAEFMATSSRTIPKSVPGLDVPKNAFEGLAKQDREFFERKLGKGKK